MIDAGHGLFNGIVEWGEDGKPKPDLAASWEPKNGAKDWIFNLRKGMKFSERQGIHRRRRDLFAELSSRRHQVGRQVRVRQR